MLFCGNFVVLSLARMHLQVLLTYVEEDLYDPMRQSTAFPLLKVSGFDLGILNTT